MPCYSSLTFVILNLSLIVHAQSHLLNARQPAPPELIDILDDDLLYGSTPAGYGYETLSGPEPTTMPYGGLFDDPFLSHTGSQSTTSTTSTTSSTTAHTTKPTQVMSKSRTEPPHTTSSSAEEPTATAFSPPGTQTDAEAVPHNDAKQWKIIGLVVICITFIGVSTLAIVFFDAWWGFLRAVVCRRRYGQEREDMVPDWEKRSWEYKIPNEDRYATTGSMENLTANAAGIGSGAGRVRGGTGQVPDYLPNPHPLPTSRLPSPQPMYVPEIDRHPLEPLVRRPSTNPRSPYAFTASHN